MFDDSYSNALLEHHKETVQFLMSTRVKPLGHRVAGAANKDAVKEFGVSMAYGLLAIHARHTHLISPSIEMVLMIRAGTTKQLPL